jgi:S1-C subfamily serine protease
MSKIAKKLKSLVKTVAVAITVFGFVASAPNLKDAYYRYSTGDQVVMISKDNGGRVNGGTGFHVKAKSGTVYIVTNRHVCEISKDGYVDVLSSSLPRPIPRRIIQKYEDHDLCLVEPIVGKKGLDIASSVDVGEDIVLVGHPNLRPLVVKKGEYIGNQVIELISGYDKSTCKGNWISNDFLKEFYNIEGICVESYYSMQASVTSYGGNSGSPVINKYGNVVGVLFAGSTRVVDDAYLVPLRHLKRFLEVY